MENGDQNCHRKVQPLPCMKDEPLKLGDRAAFFKMLGRLVVVEV